MPLSAPNSSTLLFADDAKCFKVIKDHADRIELQGDLNSLCEWSTLWKLLFNDSKCLSVTFAKPNSAEVESSYSLNNKSIAPSKRCKDLGVIVSSDCSWADHYDMILSRAYKILGLLRRSFSSSTSTASKRSLYLSLVRSHMVYCSPLWRPQLKQSIISLERLQKRASKYILNDFTSNYKERLTKIHLLPLMMLFELNDILFLIKCLKKPSKCFDITKYIRFCSTGTRSQTTHKLAHTRSNCNTSRHFYTNRLPRLWNVLPEIDTTQSIESISYKLKQFFWSHFLANFDPSNSCTLHLLCPCNSCMLTPGSHT